MTSTIPHRLGVQEQLAHLASAPVASFQTHLSQMGLAPVRAGSLDILQINVGKLCNLRCHHCHVDAGPHQVTANMTWPTFEACLRLVETVQPRTVDLTGGAPELNPHFRRFVRVLREAGVPEIIDRCNLTVLLLQSQEDLIAFLAEHRVHIIASLPAVSASQTDAQRGEGTFEKSIEALRRLNAVGYGRPDSDLKLTLISNPTGAFLPPPQSSAQRRFRAVLKKRFDIEFTQLVELTNMPINRFLEYLVQSGNFEGYMRRLSNAFNPSTVQGLMCRNTLSVGWDGTLYDCDFNQMLEMPVGVAKARSVFDLKYELLEDRRIRIARHCLGCTAGQGSS